MVKNKRNNIFFISFCNLVGYCPINKINFIAKINIAKKFKKSTMMQIDFFLRFSESRNLMKM